MGSRSDVGCGENVHEEHEKSDAELWELTVGEDVFTRAEALHELGVRCLNDGRHDEGLNFMNAALDLWREQDDLVGIGRSCYSQGTFHLKHERYDIAVPLLEEAVSSYHNAFRTLWESDALRALGSAYNSLGLTDMAQDMFIRAVAGYAEMDEYLRASLSELDLGNTFVGLFELHQGLFAFKRAIAFAQKAEEPIMVLRCNARIASILHGLGEDEDSLEISRNSIKTAEYLEDEELLMIVKDDLAGTLVESGFYAEALPLLEEVVAFWKSQNSLTSAAATDIVRVDALHGLGRTDEAKVLLEKVSAISENLNAKNNIVLVALVRAEIEKDEGLLAAALSNTLKAAALSAEMEDNWLERYSWLDVVEVHVALGNYSEGLEILDELTLEAWGDCVREQSRHRKLQAEILDVLVTQPS